MLFLIVPMGMLILGGCENRDEVDAANQRVEKLEKKEDQLLEELAGTRQRLKEVEEASRVADEGLRKRKKELLIEVRERLTALEAKNAEAVNEEMECEEAFAFIKKRHQEYEGRLIKAVKNNAELRKIGIVDVVDPESIARKIGELRGALDDAELKEQALKKEIARLKAKLGE